jgi:hypothetical protein
VAKFLYASHIFQLIQTRTVKLTICAPHVLGEFIQDLAQRNSLSDLSSVLTEDLVSQYKAYMVKSMSGTSQSAITIKIVTIVKIVNLMIIIAQCKSHVVVYNISQGCSFCTCLGNAIRKF